MSFQKLVGTLDAVDSSHVNRHKPEENEIYEDDQCLIETEENPSQ